MARAKKQTYKYVSRDERPEFMAVVAALPDAPAKLEALAEQYQRTFNAAVLAGNLDVLRAQDDALAAVAIKLNGGVSRGALGDDAPLAAIIAQKAPPLGQVPQWGQDGEFLLEVEGIRIRVRARSSTLSVVLHVDLNVVDLDKLFVSETGYRSTYIWADRSLGLTVDQAVRRDVEQMLAAKGGKPCMVKPDAFVRSRWEGVPTWLAPALQGVTRNGQLNMPLSGEALLPEPVEKVPMSNAKRQQLHRQRLKERAQIEGLKVIPLTQEDRMVLSLGLLAHEDLFHRPKDWETTKKPGFDSLLVKLWPEGDDGRYLAEPVRSTRRPAAFLRDELERTKKENERLKAALNEIAIEVVAPAPVARDVVTGKPMDMARLNQEVDWLVRELNKATAEIDALKQEQVLLESERNKAFDANRTLTERLRRAGLSTDYRKQPGE